MAFIRSKSNDREDNGIITAIAIDKDKNSQYAVKWAVDNLFKNKSSPCILVHVQCKTLHPEDINAVPKEVRPPTQQELQMLFLPYRGFCARRGIEAREVVLHDIDVPSALTDYIVSNSISNIVVGAPNRNLLTRKFRNADLPSSLLKSVPESCAVYVISSKGNVQASRSSSQPQTPTSAAVTPRQAQTSSSTAATPWQHQTSSSNAHTPKISFGHGIWESEGSDRVSFNRSSDSMQMTMNDKSRFRSKTISPRTSIDSHSSDVYKDSISDSSGFSEPQSFQTTDISSEILEFSFLSGSSKSSSSSQTPKALEAEMRRLKLELKQSMEMYNSACKEAVLAKKMARELSQLQTLEARRLEEAKLAEEAALNLAAMERQKTKAAMEAAQMARQQAEMEAQKRRDTEMWAQHEIEEKQKTIESLTRDNVQYRKYTIEEIEVATNYFASSNKIGEGGYGPVYKGMLNHIAVAVKVLRPDISQGQRQFKNEVEVLSSMRHPHMVILLGACPEYGCLVYEYMEKGSLEDRLFRKDNTPPIPWRTRFQIASEIATGLLFLHETKPEPLVHRDLKPANILLDRNYVTKISDVGLARLIPPSVAGSITQYCVTAAAGTFCYVDPEYQQTGKLSVKSDIYSLGIMLLQLITAKTPMGLSHLVEQAIEDGTFSDMLDSTVTGWPVEEALSLAKVALKCCELRKKDRPDLATVVLPELQRLSDLALVNEAAEREVISPITYPDSSDSHVQSHRSQEWHDYQS